MMIDSDQIAGLWVEGGVPKDPFLSPMKVFRQHMFREPLELSKSQQARKRLSRSIFMWWKSVCREPGDAFANDDTFVCGPLLSKPQGFKISRGVENPVIVEIANDTEGWEFASEGQIVKIPEHLLFRCQAHAYACRADQFYLVVLFRGEELRWTVGSRDRVLGEKLAAVAQGFENNYSKTGAYPSLTSNDSPDDLPQDAVRHERTLQSQHCVIADLEYAAAVEVRDWFEIRVRLLENAMCQICGGQPATLSNGSQWSFSSHATREGEGPGIDIEAAVTSWWEAGLKNQW